MAYNVTALVRAARLPASMGKRRLAAKAVLLALADRCNDRGENAWPSKATIAAECEIDTERTVFACLKDLQALGLIFELAPPRQHRPRVWGLKLQAIQALVPVTAPEGTPLTSLPTTVSGDTRLTTLGAHEPSGRQAEHPGRQAVYSGGTPLTSDPVLMNGPSMNSTTPLTPLAGGLNARASTRKPSKAEHEWASKVLDAHRFRPGCPHDAEHGCETRAKCIGKLVAFQRQQTLEGMHEELAEA